MITLLMFLFECIFDVNPGILYLGTLVLDTYAFALIEKAINGGRGDDDEE